MAPQIHPAERLLGGRAKFAVLRAVRSQPAESVNQLATAIGYSKTATLKAVETLVAAGIVEAEEVGRRLVVRLAPARARLVDDLEGLAHVAAKPATRHAAPVLRDELSGAELKAFARYFTRPGRRSNFKTLREEQRGLGIADLESSGPSDI